MALSELLLAVKLFTGEAEAADKYEPATLPDMAAECEPKPLNVGESVHFTALDANLETFNRAVEEIVTQKLSRVKAARLLADALLGKVSGQVKDTDVSSQTGAVAAAFTVTDAASPSEVQGAREGLSLNRKSMAQEGAYLNLLVDPTRNRPVSIQTMFDETGLSQEAITMIAIRADLQEYADAFLDQTRWDCSKALDYVATNGYFPKVGTELEDTKEEPFKVQVIVPSAAPYNVEAKSTYGEDRAALVNEWTVGDEEAEALTEQFSVVDRFARRYRADGKDAIIDLKLVPTKEKAKVPPVLAPEEQE
jgi:hypothetical protein